MKIILSFFLSSLFCLSLFAQSKTIDYGQTKAQVEILNMDCLHQRGFTGKGVTIAHLDDGFDGFDKMEAFDYARKNGLLKSQYDFVTNGPIPYEKVGSHGTNTVSVVNGYIPGEYVGTAFDANILLAHTEYNKTETKSQRPLTMQQLKGFWLLPYKEILGHRIGTMSLPLEMPTRF